MEEHPEGDIAASILTEMAVKRASSVRVMIIGDYNNLVSDRARSFMTLGRTLGKIVIGQKIPILFLFNRFRPSDEDEDRGYTDMSFAERRGYIQSVIIRELKEVYKTEESTVSSVVSRLATRAKKAITGTFKLFGKGGAELDEEITRDKDFQRVLAEAGYTAFLKYNIEGEEGDVEFIPNVEYVDPMRPESRPGVLSALGRLSEVRRDSLVFSGYNTARTEFDAAFAEKIEPLLLLAKAKARVSRFAPDLLRSLAHEAETCLSYHRKILANPGEARLSETDLKEIEESHAREMENIERRKKQLTVQLEALERKKSDLTEEITRLIEGPNVVFWQDKWREECGFFAGWWRNYRCYYPHTTPFVDWAESLESGTSRKELKEARSPNLEVYYASSTGSDCAGEVTVFVAPKDDPSTKKLIESKKGEKASAGASISGCRESRDALERDTEAAMRAKAAGVVAKVRTFQERKVRIFEEQMNHMRRVVAVRRAVDVLYETHKVEIHASASIAEKLDSNKPIAVALREYYPELLRILSAEKAELEERFVDGMFSNILLDPVQLVCSGDGHGRAYARHQIAEQLRRNGVCPDCRGPASSFIPLGPLEMEMAEIIDGLYSNALSAEESLRGLSFPA